MRYRYRPPAKASPGDSRAAAVDAAELKFRNIFEASPDYMIVARLTDGLIIEANEGFEHLSGWSRAEAMGRSVLELGFWANPEQRRELVGRLLREHHVRNYPILFRRRDGSLIHVLASVRDFLIGDVRHYVSILRDVTEEERVRRALAASETRLRTIFEASPYAIVLNRAGDQSYVEANPAYERIFGVSAAVIVGKRITDVGFVFRDLAAIKAETQELLTAGHVENREVTVMRPDQRWITFLYSSRVVDIDGERTIVTVAADITSHKMVEEGLRQTEKALRDSEVRFSTLFESSPVALGVFHGADQDYTAIQFNEVWYRTFGYSPEQVIGRRTIDFALQVNPEDRPRILELIETRGEAADFECWLRRADGEALLCLVIARRLQVGDSLLVLSAYMDITRQRKIEAELHELNLTLERRIDERSQELQRAQEDLLRSEKLAALGSMVAGVAHELNTPIGNAIMVVSTLAENTREISEALAGGLRRTTLENYLDNINSGGQILIRNLNRAAELIQSFKNVAVDQSNDERRIFDLDIVVRETLELLGFPRTKGGIAISSDIPAGMTLDSYPGALEQVIINLVNNALVHAFVGRQAGSVQVLAEPLSRGWIRLGVVDDGCGIAAEHLTRIFEPFFTTSFGTGGSGLGLSVVMSLVENVLGGRIGVESVPEKGTRMWVEMPATAPLRAPQPTPS